MSYPNEQDRRRSRSYGIPESQLGGNIFIHGIAPQDVREYGHQRLYQSTRGCIALLNNHMEDLFRIIKVKTRVVIKP